MQSENVSESSSSVPRFILSFFCLRKYLQRLLGMFPYCRRDGTFSERMHEIYNFTHQVDTFFPVHRSRSFHSPLLSNNWIASLYKLESVGRLCEVNFLECWYKNHLKGWKTLPWFGPLLWNFNNIYAQSFWNNSNWNLWEEREKNKSSLTKTTCSHFYYAQCIEFGSIFRKKIFLRK